MINVGKLDIELKDAGITISGCNSSGVVWDASGAEIQSDPAVAAVISAHDPNEYDVAPEMPLAQVGDTVSISIQGAQGTTTITIDGIDLDVDIDATGKSQVDFVPDSAGEYVIKHAGKVAVLKAV